MSSRKFNNPRKTYSKRNFSEVIELLIPSLYLEEDIATFGKVDSLIDNVIESHINIANNITSIIEVSAGTLFPALDSLSAVAPFFVKQTNYTNVKPYEFFRNILIKDEKTFSSFSTSAAFKEYVDTDLIPKIQTNSPAGIFTQDELIQTLGWFYFLASGNTQSVQPSSIVSDYLVNKIYKGEELTLVDGINCLTEYLWSNNSFSGYIPSEFRRGSDTYTSGTQQLEKLKTINEVIYSNEYFSKFDTKILDSLSIFEQLGQYEKEQLSNGPFWRLLKAFSFSFADAQNDVDKLSILYDLQDCPDEYLQELAYLIGWDLLGSDPDRWRLQLYNAVDLYKKTGTKQSIQTAINSVFTEGIVEISSDIIELWESYIPFLIMYALATESKLFKGFDTWTQRTASDLNIYKYDRQNFETNIRLAVDKILLNLFEDYPDLFRIGGRPFPRNSNLFQFNYRGRDYPIPPFEEIPYYLNCGITPEFVTSLVDQLVCFGVNEDFADKVGSYILENTLDSQDEIREENSWLMFASGMALPPNFDTMLEIIGDEREKYLSLWNGKSSHFYLAFRADDFDFTKVTYESNSKQVILIAAKAAKRFSPAHAIPNFKVVASASSTYDTAYGTLFSVLFFDSIDNLENASPTLVISNNENRGVDFLGGAAEFTEQLARDKYASLAYGPYTSGLYTTEPRNTFRRRNYRSSLNINGYYDRTGFNPPVFLDSAIPNFTASEDASLLTLGLIPSSMTFVSAFTDGGCSSLISSIDPILDRCNTTNDSFYYGYYTSATLKTRGYNSLANDAIGSTMYLDRGDLDPFMYLIYRIEEEKVKRQAQKIVEDNYEFYSSSMFWWNASGSIANSLLACNTLLSSLDEYRSYTFGQKIHRLFNIYTSAFNYHPLPGYSDDLNKANILTHCYGSILHNSKLDERGNYNLYATNLQDTTRLTLQSLYFSGAASSISAYDTFVYTQPSSLIASSISEFNQTVELVNSGIMSNVEIIHTSGASRLNEFTLYDITSARDSYAFNNPLVKLKAINGLPRLRFTIKGSDLTEAYGDHRDNSFLTPDHEFKLSIKGLAALDDGSLLTDSRLGIWIHTGAENGQHSWHFNNSGEWELLNYEDVTKDKILSDLTHIIQFDDPDIGDASSLQRPCRAPVSGTVDRAITQFTENYFSTKEIKFNTFNKCKKLIVPQSYYKHQGQVHRLNQTYYVEIFMLPTIDNSDKFILLDELSLRNESLWDHTRIELDPVLLHRMTHPLCSYKKLDLAPDDIRTIFRFFNQIAGKDRTEGPLGRSATKSSYVNLGSGGSRLSYRFNPNWFVEEIDNNTCQYVSIRFDSSDAEETILEGNVPGGQIPTVPIEGELEGLNIGFWFG